MDNDPKYLDDFDQINRQKKEKERLETEQSLENYMPPDGRDTIYRQIVLASIKKKRLAKKQKEKQKWKELIQAKRNLIVDDTKTEKERFLEELESIK